MPRPATAAASWSRVGPAIVSKAALVFDPSVDQPAEIAAKHAELSVAGVVPRDTA